MLKMASQIETIVNTYKTLTKVPSLTGGVLSNSGDRVTAHWSVRNLDKGKSTKYTTEYTLDDSLHVVGRSDFGADVSTVLLSAISPKERYKAVIREEKDAKDAKKQYLEVWNRSTLAHCIDLTALDLHGDVYADSEFGNLDWDQDETKVVYVAERKLPKCEPYIQRKDASKGKSDEQKVDDPPEQLQGEKYVYREDWGEQLVGKYTSVVVVCAVGEEAVSVLDRLPRGCCVGQVRFAPDGGSVVGVAWRAEPRRLGLLHCTNRRSFIFCLSLSAAGPHGEVSGGEDGEVSVRSPRYSPRGDLVWMQRAADGPHHAAHCILLNRQHSKEVVTLVDIVETEKSTVSGEPFYGAYNQSLPRSCFSRDGGRLVFSTAQKNEVRSYVVHVDTGTITDISIKTVPGSTSVLDVKNDVILAMYSNVTTPGQVYCARLPTAGHEAAIEWVRVSETERPATRAALLDYLHLTHEGADGVNSFSAIYSAPRAEGAEGRRLPLVVWPHGGPHGSFVNSYALDTAFFHALGFATLQINYRGSSGAGDASLRYLPGKIGDADVKDCKLATDVALTNFPIDQRQVMLYGGSHGGFLVTSLSGQYPAAYRAVVARNPVVDLAAMFNYTDINDWCNYRGSIGAGDKNVRSLIGHVGDYDVADCYLALTTLLERDSTSCVVLNGGSYGGLVAAHLAASRPGEFRGAVMRNPLLDLATKGPAADNRDGCAVEAGFEFTEAGPVTEEQLLLMRRCSPLVHVHKVRAPTAMMLGSGDKRVPYYQGLEYIRRLKANGVETKVYMYEDNHSLASQEAEMDSLINTARWFLTHVH